MNANRFYCSPSAINFFFQKVFRVRKNRGGPNNEKRGGRKVFCISFLFPPSMKDDGGDKKNEENGDDETMGNTQEGGGRRGGGGGQSPSIKNATTTSINQKKSNVRQNVNEEEGNAEKQIKKPQPTTILLSKYPRNYYVCSPYSPLPPSMGRCDDEKKK